MHLENVIELLRSNNKCIYSYFYLLHNLIDEWPDLINYLNGNNFVHKTAKIHPTAILGSNIFIDENVEIGPFCWLRRDVAILKNTKIGYGVELDKCIIGEQVKIAHQACIGRSIICTSCNLAYGFVSATKRLDEKKIYCKIPDDKNYISNQKHHGVVIGKRVVTGINAVTMPGASIVHGRKILPGEIVRGWYDK